MIIIKRVLSGAIVAIIFIFTLVVFPMFAFNILATILGIIAVFELINALDNIGYRPKKIMCYLSCLTLLYFGLKSQNIINDIINVLFLMFLLITSINIILRKNEEDFKNIGITLFIILYVVFLLSFVLKTFYIEVNNDKVSGCLVWFILLGSAITDMFAHIIGSNFGKHKLCPKISPNKTIEGAIGGLFGGVLSFIIFSFILNNYFGFNINYLLISLIGLITSVIGQIGDLFASSIKRITKIKDFGKIMPRSWWYFR